MSIARAVVKDPISLFRMIFCFDYTDATMGVSKKLQDATVLIVATCGTIADADQIIVWTGKLFVEEPTMN